MLTGKQLIIEGVVVMMMILVIVITGISAITSTSTSTSTKALLTVQHSTDDPKWIEVYKDGQLIGEYQPSHGPAYDELEYLLTYNAAH